MRKEKFGKETGLATEAGRREEGQEKTKKRKNQRFLFEDNKMSSVEK